MPRENTEDEPRSARSRMSLEVKDCPATLPGTCVFRRRFLGIAEEKWGVIEAILAELLGPNAAAKDRFGLQLCLDEAIQNAIHHGNRDDASKSVEVSVHSASDGWRIAVHDAGDGFDPSQVPDPRGDEGIESESGRGLFILQQYMNGVAWFDGGRTLVLTKLIAPTR